jgi:cytoskeletal protein CcmA (bactofilin family)
MIITQRVTSPFSSMSNSTVFELHPGLVMKGHLSMAKDIVLTGKFEGNLQPLGCLTVAPGGVVIGSIEAGALVLEPGYRVEGGVKVGAQPRTKLFEETTKPGGGKSGGGLWSGSFQKLKELALGRK